MSKQRPKEKSAAEQPAAPTLARHVPGVLLAAVVALLVATPILPSEAATVAGTHATLGVLWCLLLGCWSLAAATQLVPAMRLDWTLVAGFVLIALTALSVIVMGSTGGGRPALNTLWVWVNYGIGAFLLRQLVTSPVQSRAVIAVMVALAIGLSMHACYQFFVSQPAFRNEYKANPEKYLREAGYSTDKQSIERKHIEDRIFSVEPTSTFSLTNSLAGFLAPWLIIALGMRFGGQFKGNVHRTRIAIAIAALLILGCLLLTKSRTAIIAACLGGVLLFLYDRRGGFQVGWKIPAVAAGLLVLVGLGVVVAGGLDAEVLSEAPKTLLYRLEYWRSTAAMIADYPLLGVGPGRFKAFYTAYKLPQASETVADPHNFLLEVWATAGTPALLALLAMVVVFALEVWSRRQITICEPATPQSPALDSPTYDAGFVLAGALVGLLFGFLLAASVQSASFLSSRNAAIPGLLLGLPAAGIFWWSIAGWIREGELRPPQLAIGLIVLGVNLLVAGAASFPGVAQTAWILIPLVLSLNQPATPPPTRHWRSWIAAGASVILFAACYFTSYSPVLHSGSAMSAAELIPFQSTDQLAAHYEQAAAADPWAAEPWQRLAQTRLTAWLRTGYEQDLADFRKAADEYACRELPSTPAAEQRENWYLQIFARSKKPEDLDEALAAARLAAQRYPASARIHAELAAVWKLAGDDSAAQMEANEALRLDQLNPHLEFKLKNQHLPQYVWDEEQQTVLGTGRPETAEQSMQELRKALRANP